MASSDGKNRLPEGWKWRKGFPRWSWRLLCCSCLRGRQKDREEKIIEASSHPNLKIEGSSEEKAILITVEDMGIVNASFSLSDEDPVTNSKGLLASTVVSATPRLLKKKGLKHLSALSIQPQLHSAAAEDNGQREEYHLQDERGTDGPPATEGLLTPIINLIPPTPSNVVNGDRFFDSNSEESVGQTSSGDQNSNCCEQEAEKEKVEGLKENKHESTEDHETEPENDQEEDLGDEDEAVSTAKGDKEKITLRSVWRGGHMTPLLEHQKKSESASFIHALLNLFLDIF